jgi:hypothetical protein
VNQNSISERKNPTRRKSLIFRGKAALLQARRGWQNLFDRKIKRFSAANELENWSVVAESKTALWTEASAAERFLIAGKIQNLRLAVQKINGLEIPGNEIFSFWAHVGRTTRRKGFVAGRELREGCVIPSIGGGLCQLSNALYDAALQAGFEIVERHAHTQIIAGSLAETGRDATVFWNYVDLRFKSAVAFRIQAKLDSNHLSVKFWSKTKPENLVQIASFGKNKSVKTQNSVEKNVGSCATCGIESCFRSVKPEANLDFGRTAFLLDEFSPEFDRYVSDTKTARDFLFVPVNGKRFRKANYAWTTEGFARAKQSFLITLLRSYKSRKLAAQGAKRQLNLLAMSEKLARDYARKLTFDQTHIVVQQNLLPFLWRGGYLGGRDFDVLMTALPMNELQKRLDFACALHSESKTLGDFRAEQSLIEAETEALQAAQKIVTPHSEIARLFPEKAELFPWQLPPAKVSEKRQNEKFTIVFPASTVGRKGAYELREALRGLDVKLIVLGAELEGADFWRGFEVEKRTGNSLETADLVVLPAFVEHKPRRLLQAAANRIPVIASKACGVETIEGVINIEAGDADSLRREIEKVIFAEASPALKEFSGRREIPV